MRPPANAILTAVVLACGGDAFADIIVLRNGSRMEGVVEREEPGPKCEACGGTGQVACPACGGLRQGRACARCGGTGRVKCAACSGRGTTARLLVIRLRGGALVTISSGEVASITKKDIPPEELMPPRRSYAVRAAKLADGDAAGHLALAGWALQRGLLAEASRHARRAAALDTALQAEARRVYAAADDRREAAAARAVRSALAHVRELRFAEGLAALDAARGAHADNPLLTDAERWSRFLGREAPEALALYGRTFERFRASLKRRVDLACDRCSGRGSAACAKCGGTGEGVCARCGGAGETWCPECNGTQWRVCIGCGGTGELEGTNLGAKGGCPTCKGRGIVKCTRCVKGRLACGACGGKGKVPGGCGACAGSGRIPCAACLGTGMRLVTRFVWGPVREIEPGPVIMPGGAASRRRIPMWQGMRRGCMITAVRAEDVHGGAFAEQLAAATGVRGELLLLCVDNRDGREQVEYAADGRGLRLVTSDARQVEALPAPHVRKLALRFPPLAKGLGQLGPAAVLPGAAGNVVGAFPEGTDLAGAETVYWGLADPLRLARRYVPERVLEAVREGLR